VSVLARCKNQGMSLAMQDSDQEPRLCSSNRLQSSSRSQDLMLHCIHGIETSEPIEEILRSPE
jgi:hypothetical protein